MSQTLSATKNKIVAASIIARPDRKGPFLLVTRSATIPTATLMTPVATAMVARSAEVSDWIWDWS